MALFGNVSSAGLAESRAQRTLVARRKDWAMREVLARLAKPSRDREVRREIAARSPRVRCDLASSPRDLREIEVPAP